MSFNARGIVVDHAAAACCCGGSDKIVAIGASTGGVEALMRVLSSLPADSPPILIAQHMPSHFIPSFVARLDHNSALTITEARDGEPVVPGHAYLAPGDRHLTLARFGGGYVCRLHDTDPVSGHRPSVDVLFRSVAAQAGGRAVGVLLTGMGRDGADGLLEMRRAGARTIGQDEASCVVYGMPRAASLNGAVDVGTPLTGIAAEILRNCQA